VQLTDAAGEKHMRVRKLLLAGLAALAVSAFLTSLVSD
jgi:hypothetical protein